MYSKRVPTAAYMKQYRENRLVEAFELLGSRCAHCGAANMALPSGRSFLEFDHIDPATKSFDISKGWNRKKEIFLAEIAKCQLLCVPCHNAKTDRDGRAVQHGGGASGKKNCPCAPCKVRKAEYMTRYKRPSK